VGNRVHPAGGIAHSGGEVNTRGRREASGSFLKKRTKKFLIPGGRYWLDRNSPKESKVFCGAFLQKSDPLLNCLAIALVATGR